MRPAVSAGETLADPECDDDVGCVTSQPVEVARNTARAAIPGARTVVVLMA
jgi:hypothetical protein